MVLGDQINKSKAKSLQRKRSLVKVPSTSKIPRDFFRKTLTKQKFFINYIYAEQTDQSNLKNVCEEEKFGNMRTIRIKIKFENKMIIYFQVGILIFFNANFKIYLMKGHYKQISIYQYKVIDKMITDKPSFKILQIHSDKVICLMTNEFKFIYRDYSKSQSIIKHLYQLQSLSHPSLLNVKTINVAQNIGVYFEHFTGNLTKYIGSQSQQFQQSQIINTFQSIVQVIDYMIGEGFTPSIPKLRNIVITQKEQIKFANDILISQNQDCNSIFQNKPTTHKIYEELSNLIFELSFPKIKYLTKSWKNRLKLLKKYFSQKNYQFFLTIYNKSLLNNADPTKTKKIIKKSKIQFNRRQIKLISQKNHKIIKSRLIPHTSNHQGKQNQISQQ